MATLEVITSGSGTTEAARLQNTVTAANNSGAKLQFAANRTSGGLTSVAEIAGLITNIDSVDYEGALVFSTAGSEAPAERMRIDAVGYVGIGTTLPSAALEVRQANGEQLRLAYDDTVYTTLGVTSDGYTHFESNAAIIVKAGDGNGITFERGSNESARFDGGGNFGIGQSNPTRRLDVLSTSSPQVKVAYDATAYATLGVTSGSELEIVSNNGNISLKCADGNGILFFDGSTENARFDSVGSFGLGSTNPTARLDVNSDVIRLRTAKTPSSSSASGNQGDICWDSSYLYICTATNTWRRIAHSTW